MSAASPIRPAPHMASSGFGSDSYGVGGSHGGRPGSGGAGGPPKPHKHVKDLAILAGSRINPNLPIKHLLGQAEEATKQADALLSFRKPDLAYLEYLVASELVVNIIPRHKDAPALNKDRGTLHILNRQLIQRINEQHTRFEKIKEIIIADNKRNGTVSESERRGNRQSQPTAPNGHAASQHARNATVSMPEIPEEKDQKPTSNSDLRPFPTLDGLMDVPSPPRARPTPSPKPDALRGHATQYASNGAAPPSAQSITDRFKNLRMAAPPVQPPQNADSASRPLGPRAMPAAPTAPPKLPLNTQFALPQEPTPAYSPARNMAGPASIPLPRSTVRSLAGTSGRSNSIASLASQHGNGDDSDTQSIASTRSVRNGPPRRKSVHLPLETKIPAEKLYDYLKMYDVLVIDVRNREDFDQGHIWTRSLVCIEPTALRDEMSAEQLQDSLVLSPDTEQDLFDRRDQFDLVVYYDQSTRTNDFLTRGPMDPEETTLKRLNDALLEFNQEKPLQRPPILLMGGLDAWADLVGEQALIVSDTAMKSGAKAQSKPARPIRRVPLASNASRLNVQKRRLRDYNPLNADEERKWLEKARSESIAIDRREVGDENEAAQVEEATPFVRGYEDFFRRFPDIEAQESMTMAPSRTDERQPEPATARTPPAPSHPPPPVPSAPPTAPPIAPLPAIPSRPPPALSRVSYSGVHDRSHDQRAPSQPPALPPYIAQRPQVTNPRLPRTGLVNFGATCYMNATIQCLSVTTPLSMFFLDDAFRSCLQRENWKGTRGVISELYANLIRSLWKGDVEAIRPTSFRKFCTRLNSEWGSDRQQDAKEFLEFLVDCLHEDLNANWQRTPLRELTAKEEAIREKTPKTVVAKKEWHRYTHREMSFITDLFAGQHASRLRCTYCNFTSTTYEAFYSISVEIPRSGVGDIRDCLRSYCAEERLSGDEVWKCPNCRQEREATKQITITRAPQFLVVHFKRFSASHHESARKVRTPIEFPLNGLDLEPFMLPQPSPEQAREIAARYGDENAKSEISMTPPYLYDAYAVMRHIGTTLSSGHYISLVKDKARGCWRTFNDTMVTDFQPDMLAEPARLQNEQAYIVFFQRVPIR